MLIFFYGILPKQGEIKMIRQISIAFLVAASTAVVADDHSDATPGPVETWNCVLNEGKTLDDVRKV